MMPANKSLNREIIEPRMRSTSRTLVPDEDFEDYPVVKKVETKSRLDSYLEYLGWTRPNTGNNRTVEPVLKNDRGEMVNSNRSSLDYDDPYKPW
jgi:hypothetical protein